MDFLNLFILVCSSVHLAYPNKELELEFRAWEKLHNLSFPCRDDESYAFANWFKNKAQIDEQQNLKAVGKSSATYNIGTWSLSYLDQTDMSKRLNGLLPDITTTQMLVEPRYAYIGGFEIIPAPLNITFFDWTAEGAVIPGVRNQGECLDLC